MGYSKKYGNVSTTEGYIPDDEPVFMLRGRDVCAIPTIASYLTRCIEAGSPKSHQVMVLDALDEFGKYMAGHRDEMQIPASKRHGGMADV